MIATLSSMSSSSSRGSTKRSPRRAEWSCQRREGMARVSSKARIAPSDRSSLSSSHVVRMLCVLVLACCSTGCSSFTVPHRITRQQQQQQSFAFRTREQPKDASFHRRRTEAFSQQKSTILSSDAIINGSAEENVSSKIDDSGTVSDSDDEDDVGASSSSSSSLPLPPTSNLEFDDVAESPAPPLNFEKYLTMQKKRVPVTIRYSPSSGLKPYYLTVAKRIKDQYPDVLIERIKVTGEDGGGGETMDGESGGAGTFEVIVDGKIVVRTNQRAGNDNGGSIFVSMTEMDLAIARARRRRRPSTAYGENGQEPVGKRQGDEVDGYGKSRLEVLKQKAQELRRNKTAGGIKNSTGGSD